MSRRSWAWVRLYDRAWLERPELASQLPSRVRFAVAALRAGYPLGWVAQQLRLHPSSVYRLLRHARLVRACVECGGPINPRVGARRGQRFCSDRRRLRAWRRDAA